MGKIRILAFAVCLAACGADGSVPLMIETARNDDGAIKISYKNFSQRPLCVSGHSLSIDPLATYPGKVPAQKVSISEMDRKFLEFIYFSDKNIAPLEAWRGAGVTATNAVEAKESVQLLIQAVYCDDLFSQKPKIKIFEYFEMFPRRSD